MTLCTNCQTHIDQNYCPNCGQAVQQKRIDRHYIQHEIEHVLHFEKGIFYTVRELLLRPGQNVREFISGNRSRLVKPIIFIIVTSLVYTVINHFFHVDDGYVSFSSDKATSTTAISDWVRSHYGYANIVMGIFIALWLKLFFSKSGYNFFETLILLCFVMGMGMLLLSVFVVIEGTTKVAVMVWAGRIAVLYCVWAIGQFFDKSKVTSYLKSFAAYVLGMLTFSGGILLLGYVVDVIGGM